MSERGKGVIKKNFAARNNNNCKVGENELGLTIKGTKRSIVVVSVMFV